MRDLTRRDVLRGIGAAAAATAAPALARPADGDAAEGEPRPNVVLIMCDDMGWGDPRCMNPRGKLATPHIDRLAREGIRFTDAHSPSAVCSPTRYALLTGRYAWRTRLKRGVLGIWDPPLIAADRPTLGGMLQRCGYDTACVGKWHLGWRWSTTDGKPPVGQGRFRNPDSGANVDFTRPAAEGPTTRGFDHFYGKDTAGGPPHGILLDDRVTEVPTERADPKAHGMLPGPMVEGWSHRDLLGKIGDRCEAYLDAKAGHANPADFGQTPGAPFFLYVPLPSPHKPHLPAKAFAGTSGVSAYGDLCREVDHTVGRILAALDRHGQADNTLVIFTSDNGSDQAGSVRGHRSNGPWRGGKADVWEGGHRVPFVARWPGRIPPGATCGKLLNLVDMMATLAAATGCELPEGAAPDSYNALGLLTGGDRTDPPREASVMTSSRGDVAVRRGKWKLILPVGGKKPQLYDLDADPRETNDLAASRPALVIDIKALLTRFKRTGRSVPRT